MYEKGKRPQWLAGADLGIVTDNKRELDRVMLGIYKGLCRDDYPNGWVQIHQRDNDLLTLFGLEAFNYKEAALIALGQIQRVKHHYNQIAMVGALILAPIKPPMGEVLTDLAKLGYPHSIPDRFPETGGLDNVVSIEYAFAVRAQK